MGDLPFIMATINGENMMMPAIFSLGYAGRKMEEVYAIAERYGIEYFLDVRSVPFSFRHPDYDKDALQVALRARDIKYAYLGGVLGGMTIGGPNANANRPISYDEFVEKEGVKVTLKRLIALSEVSNVCLLCAEKNPTHCHRFRLIGRRLSSLGVEVGHIVSRGCVAQRDIEAFLRKKYGVDNDLFMSAEEGQNRIYSPDVLRGDATPWLAELSVEPKR